MKKYMNKLQDNQNKSLYLLGWAALAALACFYFLITRVPFFQGMPCWFRAATGFYCPGCGATRSLYLLVNGHPLLALAYYPAVPYAAAVYLWFMATNTIELLSGGKLRVGMRPRILYLYIALALIAGNWIVKNLPLIPLIFHYGT